MNYIGKYVIVRSNMAGVFAGTLVEKSGTEVVLENARCLWRWSGAASLMQLANEGVKNPKDCKFTVTVESVCILGVDEIVLASVFSEANVKAVSEWKV